MPLRADPGIGKRLVCSVVWDINSESYIPLLFFRQFFSLAVVQYIKTDLLQLWNSFNKAAGGVVRIQEYLTTTPVSSFLSVVEEILRACRSRPSSRLSVPCMFISSVSVGFDSDGGFCS
jgi:hypothetical protein